MTHHSNPAVKKRNGKGEPNKCNSIFETARAKFSDKQSFKRRAAWFEYWLPIFGGFPYPRAHTHAKNCPEKSDTSPTLTPKYLSLIARLSQLVMGRQTNTYNIVWFLPKKYFSKQAETSEWWRWWGKEERKSRG